LEVGFSEERNLMTGTVTEHYENLLAEHYSWLFGGSEREKINTLIV
jgi:hypothetical protein